MKNRLKQILREGKVAIGTEISIPDSVVAEVISQVGFDWVMIDTEHSPMDPANVQILLQAMSASKIVPLARVTWNDRALIKRLLDIGVHGLIVPWVSTKDEAIHAVRSMKYPPLGFRGVGPRRAAMGDPDYFTTANKELFLGVQIETQQAVENIDEILSVEGIDAAVVGAGDLTMSMGIFADLKNPRFQAAIEKVVDACKRHNVVAGWIGPDDVTTRVRQGFRLISKPNDLNYLRIEAERTLAETKAAVEAAKISPP